MKDLDHLALLRLMLLSRESDIREGILIRQGKGFENVPSAGHEALIAITMQLTKDDYLYTYYRGHHLMLGKGLSRYSIARELLFKETAPSKGRIMSPTIGDRSLNIFPPAASTASQCLPAVGTAWGQQLKSSHSITVCSVGDGATREGEFYEAICFAVQNKLPIIFVIEDNRYAISTKTDKMMPFRLGIFDHQLYKRINGRCVFEVYTEAKKIIQSVRNQEGPKILWCEVDRLNSHSINDDHARYRSKEELDQLIDPITLFSDQLIEKNKITRDEFEKMRQDIRNEIKEIYQSVEAESDLVDGDTDIKSHLYAKPSDGYRSLPSMDIESLNMVQGMNQIFLKGLAEYPELIFFGQDIEDPKGGVFGFTQRLSTLYPDRVFNAPIAEATIIGCAVGLSVMGYKPIFEIQFIDFITPGFDQLVSQVSTLRWRTYNEWQCPLVLYAPYGAYLPGGGLSHSQSNDGWWAHVPGLRVAIPSTPQDVIELFWSAFQDDDPSLILIPKHIFRKKLLPKIDEFSSFGKAKIRREGSDVSVIAWGNTVELAEKVASRISNNNSISVEIIDLRTLVPCDWECIEKSLKKTGRLVVVHEDNKTCGFGASIVAELVSNPRCFEYLYSPPKVVARDDIPIAACPTLEYAALPSEENIYQAIIATINYTE